MSKTFTQSDVASHNKANDLYIIVDGDVYDLTKFQDDHPGTRARLITLLQNWFRTPVCVRCDECLC